jgi:hypothetical protein
LRYRCRPIWEPRFAIRLTAGRETYETEPLTGSWFGILFHRIGLLAPA